MTHQDDPQSRGRSRRFVTPTLTGIALFTPAALMVWLVWAKHDDMVGDGGVPTLIFFIGVAALFAWIASLIMWPEVLSRPLVRFFVAMVAALLTIGFSVTCLVAPEAMVSYSGGPRQVTSTTHARLIGAFAGAFGMILLLGAFQTLAKDRRNTRSKTRPKNKRKTRRRGR